MDTRTFTGELNRATMQEIMARIAVAVTQTKARQGAKAAKRNQPKTNADQKRRKARKARKASQRRNRS